MAYLHNDLSGDLAPELHLLGAIVHQVVKDAHSGRPDVREEARAFLSDPESLTYWERLLGLDDGVLLERITQVLRAGR